MDRYLVVSSDGHAGPPAARYREYLDPEFREPFDEHQRQLRELAALVRPDPARAEFVAKWEKLTEPDGGLAAAYESEVRNKVLDDQGVVAEARAERGRRDPAGAEDIRVGEEDLGDHALVVEDLVAHL